MKIVGLIDEDFTQYRRPSMFIAFPYCTFKCEKECGKEICQNSELAKAKKISIEPRDLVDRYLNNFITSSIACGGLEPFDSFDWLLELVDAFRERTDDDIIIYSGYNKDEVLDKIEKLKEYKNIIVKFGRFVPDQKSHYDECLGIELASPNQYAERIS